MATAAGKSTSKEHIRLLEQSSYYDIMILGHTGQGKSTTADKLVLANTSGREYTGSSASVVVQENSGIPTLVCDDISLWVASHAQVEVSIKRLKNMVDARTGKWPHEGINKFRESQGAGNTRTMDCELLANNTTRVRVFDVPGFYDAEAMGGEDSFTELEVMRKLVVTQNAFKLNFRKVLYFLPVRGVLERAGAVVQAELRILIYYFGRSVLSNLVLVATNQKRLSLSPEGAEFSEEEREETLANFKKCLMLLKLYRSESEIPQIPLICVSLSETCESILEKVKAAVITGPETIQLSFEVCHSCGKSVNEIEAYHKVSKCHPKFIPDYRWYHKFMEKLALFFTVGRVKSLQSYFTSNEICIHCHAAPGSEPCYRIGDVYEYNGQSFQCEHSFSGGIEITRSLLTSKRMLP